MRLAAEPWMLSTSPSRPKEVGMTKGCPSATKPTWQRIASSRIWLTASRSYTARCGSRTMRVRGVGLALLESEVVDVELLDMELTSRAGAKSGERRFYQVGDRGLASQVRIGLIMQDCHARQGAWSRDTRQFRKRHGDLVTLCL